MVVIACLECVPFGQAVHKDGASEAWGGPLFVISCQAPFMFQVLLLACGLFLQLLRPLSIGRGRVHFCLCHSGTVSGSRAEQTFPVPPSSISPLFPYEQDTRDLDKASDCQSARQDQGGKHRDSHWDSSHWDPQDVVGVQRDQQPASSHFLSKPFSASGHGISL